MLFNHSTLKKRAAQRNHLKVHNYNDKYGHNDCIPTSEHNHIKTRYIETYRDTENYNLEQKAVTSLFSAFLYQLCCFTSPILKNAIMSIKACPSAIIYPRLVRQAAMEKVSQSFNNGAEKGTQNTGRRKDVGRRRTDTKQPHVKLLIIVPSLII